LDEDDVFDVSEDDVLNHDFVLFYHIRLAKLEDIVLTIHSLSIPGQNKKARTMFAMFVRCMQ